MATVPECPMLAELQLIGKEVEMAGLSREAYNDRWFIVCGLRARDGKLLYELRVAGPTRTHAPSLHSPPHVTGRVGDRTL
eukprot:5072518-Prymnesium_polylepis.3